MTHAVVDHTKLVKPSGAKPPRSKFSYEAVIQRCTLAIRALYITYGTGVVITIFIVTRQHFVGSGTILALLLVGAFLLAVTIMIRFLLSEGRSDAQSALYRWHQSVPQGLVTNIRQGEQTDYVTLYGYTRAGVLTHETHKMDFDFDMPPTKGEYIDIRSYRASRGVCASCGGSAIVPVAAAAVIATTVAVAASA